MGQSVSLEKPIKETNGADVLEKIQKYNKEHLCFSAKYLQKMNISRLKKHFVLLVLHCKHVYLELGGTSRFSSINCTVEN